MELLATLMFPPDHTPKVRLRRNVRMHRFSYQGSLFKSISQPNEFGVSEPCPQEAEAESGFSVNA